jgi:hypothetical protein
MKRLLRSTIAVMAATSLSSATLAQEMMTVLGEGRAR